LADLCRLRSADAHKPYKFGKNRARDPPLEGHYIGKIPFFSFGAVDTHAKFHLDRCKESPLRGEKPKIRKTIIPNFISVFAYDYEVLQKVTKRNN